MTPRVYYFGVLERGGAGHYLHNPFGGVVWRDEVLPFRMSILDGGLLPQNKPQEQGKLVRAVIGGWTVVSFWDRTGDSRPGSCSAFVAEGVHGTDAVLVLAREKFPRVFERFTFPLQEVIS